MGNEDVAQSLRQISLADSAIPRQAAVRLAALARSSITFGDGNRTQAQSLGGLRVKGFVARKHQRQAWERFGKEV